MAETMKAIRVEQPGQGYRLVAGNIPRPAPGPGAVLIKVAAAGVNRADIAQAMGAYPPPPGAPKTLGLEVSGTIAAIGSGVSGHAIGDAVCALLGGGGYAEYCVTLVTQAGASPWPRQ